MTFLRKPRRRRSALMVILLPDYGKEFSKIRGLTAGHQKYLSASDTIRILITVYVVVLKNEKLGARSSRVAVVDDAASMSTPAIILKITS